MPAIRVGSETSNIQHPTSNLEHPMPAIQAINECWALDVGCWMFPASNIPGLGFVISSAIGLVSGRRFGLTY
jgi:hypothetical protein